MRREIELKPIIFQNKRKFDEMKFTKNWEDVKCIIRFINTVNGKIFIGFTNNIKKYNITTNLYNNTFLADAIKQYGRSAFVVEVIPFDKECDIYSKRKEFIEELGENTYNIICSIDGYDKKEENYIREFDINSPTNIGRYAEQSWLWCLINDKQWIKFIIEKNLVPKWMVEHIMSYNISEGETADKNMLVTKKKYKLSDKIGFGKYAKYTWKKIIEDDPDYIKYMIDNTFDLTLKEFLQSHLQCNIMMETIGCSYNLDGIVKSGKYEGDKWFKIIGQHPEYIKFLIENTLDNKLKDFLIEATIEYDKVHIEGNDVVKFGMYKGVKWIYVIKYDNNYLDWVINNTKDDELRCYLELIITK